MIIAAGKFKAQCLKIMDEVHNHHREVIVTKYGKPFVKLTGIKSTPKKSLFGLMKGSVTIHEDIIGPSGDKWDAEK